MRAVRTCLLASTLALPPIAAACGAGDPSSDPAASGVAAADHSEAKALFETVCFACHGTQGRGDGPASATLVPKPRDFSDPAWQSSVDDRHIEKAILFGGAAVGKSPVMPGHPHLRDKTALLRALIHHVRRLAQS